MNEKVASDAKMLKQLGWAMLLFLALAALAGIIAIVVRDIGPMAGGGIRIGCAIALLSSCLFFLYAFAAAVWAEVLKRQNDVVTFRDIIAFEKGMSMDQTRDENAFSRKHSIVSTIFKICSGAIFGIIAVLIFVITAKYIRDLIFMILS